MFAIVDYSFAKIFLPKMKSFYARGHEAYTITTLLPTPTILVGKPQRPDTLSPLHWSSIWLQTTTCICGAGEQSRSNAIGQVWRQIGKK